MSEPDKPDEGQLILYQTEAGTVRIEVLYQSDTFWLNQRKIAELFGVDIRTISEHYRNIFTSGELDEQSVLRKIRTTAAELSREATLRRIRRVQRERDRDVSCAFVSPSSFSSFVLSLFRPFVIPMARC